MKSLLCAASVAFMLLAAGLAARSAGASDDETPTIKKIMETLHKGKNAPLSTAKAALKSDSPDWSNLKESTKLIASYGAALPKNDPPRGGKGAYEKLAKAYAANAEALDKAVDKEDLKTARAAVGKLSTSCKTCHQSHRPPA
jgi:cytochrome c556